MRNRFYLFWSAETRAHPGTKVLAPAAAGVGPNRYPFFTLFFYCGLCPPFSEFFCDIMNTYGFHLLDFTPNAVLTMAIFAHLCENFVGVNPSTALFRHFFIPRAERGEPLSGGVAWISRTGKKDSYLKGELRGKWDDWRSEWCWIVEEDPQPFTALRKVPVERGKDWSDLDPEDENLPSPPPGSSASGLPGSPWAWLARTSFVAALPFCRTEEDPLGTSKMQQTS